MLKLRWDELQVPLAAVGRAICTAAAAGIAGSSQLAVPLGKVTFSCRHGPFKRP